jgi:hypothetical protein
MADDRHLVVQGGFKEEIAGLAERVQPMILRLQLQNSEAVSIATPVDFIAELR